jgi:hypothetical protein
MTTATENHVTTEADEAAEEAKAAELFAEAAAAHEGTPAEKPVDTDEGAAAATTPTDEAPGTPGEDKGGSADDQPGKIEGAAVETPAPGSGEFDWSNADPAAKAAYEAAKQQFEHKLKSANGRVSVLDRRLNELRQGSGSGGGEQEQPRKPLKELLASDELKQVAEEYPDFKSLIDVLGTVAERVDGVTDEVGQVKSTAVAAASSVEEKELYKTVPNWLDLAKDERFLGWVNDQNAEIRDTVAANWDAITNADAAAKVFTSFAEHIAPPSKEETGGGDAPSKRDRQQSGARAATVTAPTSAGGESDDADVAFAQAAAKKDRERGIRT